MKERVYKSDAKCSYKVASELLYMSERSAARYMKRLRAELGYSRGDYVSVGVFVRYYRIGGVVLE